MEYSTALARGGGWEGGTGAVQAKSKCNEKHIIQARKSNIDRTMKNKRRTKERIMKEETKSALTLRGSTTN
jgi:hypothetical protein